MIKILYLLIQSWHWHWAFYENKLTFQMQEKPVGSPILVIDGLIEIQNKIYKRFFQSWLLNFTLEFNYDISIIWFLGVTTNAKIYIMALLFKLLIKVQKSEPLLQKWSYLSAQWANFAQIFRNCSWDMFL